MHLLGDIEETVLEPRVISHLKKNGRVLVSLVYGLQPSRYVELKAIAPFNADTPRFSIELVGTKVRFTFSEFPDTLEKARTIIDPFVQQWEVLASLTYGDGVFRLRFEHSEEITWKDRHDLDKGCVAYQGYQVSLPITAHVYETYKVIIQLNIWIKYLTGFFCIFCIFDDGCSPASRVIYISHRSLTKDF